MRSGPLPRTGSPACGRSPRDVGKTINGGFGMALPQKKVMEALFVDIKDEGPLGGHSTKGTLFSSDHYHVWVHVDTEPGKQGPMHKHSADEIFYCVQGECTIHFPNGDSEILKPGMLVVLPKDQL